MANPFGRMRKIERNQAAAEIEEEEEEGFVLKTLSVGGTKKWFGFFSPAKKTFENNCIDLWLWVPGSAILKRSLERKKNKKITTKTRVRYCRSSYFRCLASGFLWNGSSAHELRALAPLRSSIQRQEGLGTAAASRVNGIPFSQQGNQ